jgi:pimeloyl-ACP methyl ester carboxylesterase
MTEYDVQHSQRMHVVHDGPLTAPPLLLIHGSGASSGFWSPVVPTLAAHHHVIRVDLPGCGQSPPPLSYDVPVQAGRVAALLDELGLSAVATVGHSSGGYVATALAEQRPDLVRSLALSGGHPGGHGRGLVADAHAVPDRRHDRWVRRGSSHNFISSVDPATGSTLEKTCTGPTSRGGGGR